MCSLVVVAAPASSGLYSPQLLNVSSAGPGKTMLGMLGTG